MRIDKNYFILFASASALFMVGIGSTHLFDWDEINFAECAREMIVSGDYSKMQIAFQPFWEKPPLYIWLQALSMLTFGVNEFAARFPNALLGVTVVLLLYHIGKLRYSAMNGLLWAAFYCGSYMSFFYFKSGIIDPLFNIFILLSIFFLSQYKRRGYKQIVLSGLFAGLAVMTKGPVSWLVIGGSWGINLILTKDIKALRILQTMVWILVSVLVTSIWFGYETLLHGTWFVYTFIEYQIRLLTTPDAGHSGFLFYHWVILLFGMLPASVYFIAALFNNKFKQFNDFEKLLFISFWLVLILFTIVKTKIVHYSSYCYYPITFFAARYVTELLQTKSKNKLTFRIASISLLFIGFLVSVFIYLASHPTLLIPYIHDQFAVENLHAEVHWGVWLYAMPLMLIVLIGAILFKEFTLRTLLFQLSANAIFLFLLMLFIVPRVERITQGAYIQMCKDYAKNGSIVLPYGFKSYAHLFYGKLGKEQCMYFADDLLSNKNISVQKFLISKAGEADELLNRENVKLIKEQNGYYLFMIKEDTLLNK